jgi:8-oxoguanine deaminase
VTAQPARAWLSVIGGRPVVERGELVGVDLPRLVAQHGVVAKALLSKAGLAR